MPSGSRRTLDDEGRHLVGQALGTGRDPLAVTEEEHAAGELGLDRDRLVEGEHDPAVAAGTAADLVALRADQPGGQGRIDRRQKGEQRAAPRGQQPRAERPRPIRGRPPTDPIASPIRSRRAARTGPRRAAPHLGGILGLRG